MRTEAEVLNELNFWQSVKENHEINEVVIEILHWVLKDEEVQ